MSLFKTNSDDEASGGVAKPTGAAGISSLLRPTSIAVLGASADEQRIGGQPIHYLLRAGYQGSIYPINPKRDVVQDLRCYPSVLEVEDQIDLALIVLPAERALAGLRDCAEAGVKAVSVFSAGFAEIDDDGRRAQDEMTSIAAEAGMRLCGPNCAGMLNPHEGLAATFGSHLREDGRLIPGSIAIATQSGAVGAYAFCLMRERGIGISGWVSTGNEADVEVADVVEYLAEDDQTKVIGIYLEQVRDGQKLIRAAAAAERAGKPIVAIKVGRTAAGQRAAFSHTAALAGDAEIASAALADLGIIEVRSVEEFIDVSSAMTRARAGRRVGILSYSGGIGIMAADRCLERGLEVPDLSDGFVESLREALPYASALNPVDITGNVTNTPEHYATTLGGLMEEAELDTIVTYLGHLPLAAATGQRFLRETAELAGAQSSGKSVWVIAMDDPGGHARTVCAEADLPLFEDPIRCIDTIDMVSAYARQLASGDTRIWDRRGAEDQTKPVGERQAMSWGELVDVLGEVGIRVPREHITKTPEEAAEAAAAIGGEVVLKVVSDEIAHKTDVGGVGFAADSIEAAALYEQIMSNVSTVVPDASIDGILVQERVPAGIEALIAVENDEVFGPTVTIGTGGVLVELEADVATALAPLDRPAAAKLLAATKLSKRLAGTRGGTSADGDALLDAIVALSAFAWERRATLGSLELNPIFVHQSGVVAADAIGQAMR